MGKGIPLSLMKYPLCLGHRLNLRIRVHAGSLHGRGLGMDTKCSNRLTISNSCNEPSTSETSTTLGAGTMPQASFKADEAYALSLDSADLPPRFLYVQVVHA